MKDIYINISKIAEVKGLKSTRSLRMAINKGKYKARTIPVNGGYSYEILYSSLEPEIQEKLEDDEIRSTALVPIDNQKPTFISESARMTSLARADIVTALENIKNKYKTKKEAEFVFLDLYNSGMLLPQVYKFIGKISIGTLRRWVKSFEEKGADGLVPQRRYSSITEYNTILNYVQIVEKKTGKTKRFPLNEKLKTLIADFVKGKRDKEPLFKSLWGRRYNRITAYYMIREACKNVGLEEKIGTHSMRKTFGYHHYQQFKDVALLQKIFNHSSQQITLRYIGIEQDQIDYSYNNFVL